MKKIISILLMMAISFISITTFAAIAAERGTVPGPNNSAIATIVGCSNSNSFPINLMPNFNVVNLTSWPIFIGMVNQSNMGDFNPISGFCLSGLNDASAQGGMVLYPSIQMPVSLAVGMSTDTDYSWAGDYELSTAGNPGTGNNVAVASVPIYINAMNSGNEQQLSFVITSASSYAGWKQTHWANEGEYPNPFYYAGDSSNGITTAYCRGFDGGNAEDQFFSLIANNTNWVYALTGLQPTTINYGDNVVTITNSYLNSNALVYPNFSQAAGYSGLPNNQSQDLVAILMSGDGANISLMFIAVPSSNDPFLNRGR